MNKSFVLITIIVLILAIGVVLYMYPMKRDTTDLAVRAQEYCDMENVASVEISREAGFIKVISSLLGGGATYYSEDGGQPTECPVVGPDSTSDACKTLQTVNDWEVVCAAGPSHEQAELTAYNFILDFIEVAPPGLDADAADRIMSVLSESAAQDVSRETIASDMARFVGVQDIPDQGASVEDLQIISDTQAYLVVGLNYSGSGRVLRNVHLVAENGVWKVDRVSTPEQAQTEQFETEGNLVRNNPGMEPDTWYVVYEEPGAPALTKQLEFDSTSTCADGAENYTCDPEALESGQRALIQGSLVDEDVVRVVRLELR